jgi:TPR repeat protein
MVDDTEATQYFKLAANQSDSFGEFNSGICLMKSKGVSKNMLEAMRCFEPSAKQKKSNGQHLALVNTSESDEMLIGQNP